VALAINKSTGITAVKFEGGRIACHSFELAAECAAAS